MYSIIELLNFSFSGDEEKQLDFLLERGLITGLIGEVPLESLRRILGKSTPTVRLLILVVRLRLLNKFNLVIGVDLKAY